MHNCNEYICYKFVADISVRNDKFIPLEISLFVVVRNK